MPNPRHASCTHATWASRRGVSNGELPDFDLSFRGFSGLTQLICVIPHSSGQKRQFLLETAFVFSRGMFPAKRVSPKKTERTPEMQSALASGFSFPAKRVLLRNMSIFKDFFT